jgi:hypothetical protein
MQLFPGNSINPSHGIDILALDRQRTLWIMANPGQTDSLSEIDLTQPTINDLQAIAD